jgi:hypothetical protein
MKRTLFLIPVLVFLLTTAAILSVSIAQQTVPASLAQQVPADSALLTVDSIFTFHSRGA